MITVMEVWHLKHSLKEKALELMQTMDDLLGPPAHVHPGWCGHASFYQDLDDPTKIVMVYTWRTRELHENLIDQEEPILRSFFEENCAQLRDIYYYSELPVEVEHD